MITKDQMFEPILAACPSFQPAWREFVEESECYPDQEPFYYIVLGDLARHLVERFRSGSTEEFPAVFQVVERWHCLGDHYVREAATIGLLEGIQNIAGHDSVDPTVFEKWLLPESKKWWGKLNRFWMATPAHFAKIDCLLSAKTRLSHSGQREALSRNPGDWVRWFACTLGFRVRPLAAPE